MRSYESYEHQAAVTREAILKYIDLGFQVVFLIPGGKELSRRHVTLSKVFAGDELARLIETGVQEGCGVGLKMSCLGNDSPGCEYPFALDFDNPALYEWWRAANPALANTPTQRTPSGYHVLFISLEPWNCAKSEQLDFIGSGWYIVVEPSIHPDGEPYRWLIAPWDTPFVQVKELEELNIPKEVWEALDWEAQDYGHYDDDDSYEWQED